MNDEYLHLAAVLLAAVGGKIEISSKVVDQLSDKFTIAKWSDPVSNNLIYELRDKDEI